MSDEYETQDYGGRILWGRFAFWAAVVVLAFVLGRCTAAEGVSQAELEDARAELTEMASDNMVLREQVEALSSGGATTLPLPAGSPEPGSQATGEAQEATGEAQEAGGDGTDQAPEGEGQTYTVQPGDTINSIAQQFYGDLVNADVIAEANDIQEPSELRAGQVLRIPPEPGA